MSNWEQILKNTLKEIEMEDEQLTWDEWLKVNDSAAYDEYIAEIDEACEDIEAEWESRVRLMREASNSEQYILARES